MPGQNPVQSGSGATGMARRRRTVIRAQAVDLLTAAEAPVEVLDDRPGGPGIEGAVEIGAETAAGEEANHDMCWTAAPGADILMAS